MGKLASEDFWFLFGIAAIIVAIAWAVWIGKSQQRLCIQKHGSWVEDTCQFAPPEVNKKEE